MRCLICREDKDRVSFARNSPICYTCVHTLETRYDAPYAVPERVSINQANLTLVRAVRDQAIADDDLSDWEEFWLTDKNWKLVWYLLDEENHKIITGNPVLGVL